MKKCLLLFWHGIGDLINLTPSLRELHHHGSHADILVRKVVADSGVFEECHYATLIPLDIGSISAGGSRGAKAEKRALEAFEARKDAYDGHWIFKTTSWKVRGALMALYYEEVVRAMSLTPTVKVSPSVVYGPPEVWIPEWCEQEAAHFVESNYPKGFIFKHTVLIKSRTDNTVLGRHNWFDADEWIKRELPALPIWDTSVHGEWPNINILFAIAKKAQHRVLSSSFMVHACDAMGATMDVVNYVVEASKHWPEDPNIIKVIRRKESQTPKYSFNGGRTWWTGTI